MPVKVQIDGVGTVELDDSFTTMEPAQQEQVIAQIVAQSQGSRTAPPPQEQALPPMDGTGAGDPSIPYEDPMSFNPMGAYQGPYNDEWLEHAEADYQASLRNAAGNTVTEGPAAPADNEQMNDFASFGLGFGDSLSFGFGDEILAGLGAVTGGGDYKTIWSDGWDEAFSNNVKINRDNLKLAQEEDPWLFLGGGLASAAVPFGAAGAIARGGTTVKNAVRAAEATADAAGTTSKAARAANAAKATGVASAYGAGYGGLYGLGTGEGGLTDRLDEGAEFGLYGAAGGALGHNVIQGVAKALPAVKNAAFASKQAADNPYAAYDAEIVEDIAALARDRAVSSTDKKGRTTLDIKTVNNLETSYTAKIEEMLTKSELPEPRKLELKEAYLRRHSLTDDEVQALRGDVYGDALADGITKVQRLRELTRPTKPYDGVMGKIGQTVAGAADLAPLVGLPGTYGGATVVTNLARKAARRSNAEESKRAVSVDKLIAREAAYAKLGEKVGPSGARESRDALWEAVQNTANTKEREALLNEVDRIMNPKVTPFERNEFRQSIASPYTDEMDIEVLGRQATNRRNRLTSAAGREIDASSDRMAAFDDLFDTPPPAPAAPKPPTQREMSQFRREITDPTPDMRDVRNPVATDAQLATRVRNRDAALAKMEAGLDDFDARLADPSTAPQPRQAPTDTVDNMVQRGIQGEFRALASLERSTGLSRDDATRVLQSIKEDNPELARDVDRLIAGHGTVNPRSGPIFRPLMAAKADELEIERNLANDVNLTAKPKDRPEAPPSAAPAKAVNATRVSQIRDEWQQAEADLRAASDRDSAYFDQTGLGSDQRPTSREVDAAYARFEELQNSYFDELGMDRPVTSYVSENADGSLSGGVSAVRIPSADEMTAQIQQAQMRRVDRPQQWTEGKNRYQTQANASIDRMMQDSNVSQSSMDAIGNAPVQIRDNFKTIEEAEAFIVNRVLPDLEAARVPASEVNRVRSYLFEIAQAKPYANQQAFDEGTRYRGPGRPTEN